jgi:hypothetical protein
MRRRCLRDVLRGTCDAVGDVDDGVGGKGYVGASMGDIFANGDPGIGYKSVEWVLVLLLEDGRTWYSGSSGLGGRVVNGGGFGAVRESLNER